MSSNRIRKKSKESLEGKSSPQEAIVNSFENYVGNNVMSDIPKKSNEDSDSGVRHSLLNQIYLIQNQKLYF